MAQILLTHDDLANRRRYLNARHTFEALLQAGVLPVVNENDTVAVEEVRFNFGDNDNLSALVATLIGADLLVILSDVAGLYTADPRRAADAALVPVVQRGRPRDRGLRQRRRRPARQRAAWRASCRRRARRTRRASPASSPTAVDAGVLAARLRRGAAASARCSLPKATA